MTIMPWKLAGYAKWAAKLLVTEMFVPGGTLLVLALLLANRSSPAVVRKFRAFLSFLWGNRPPAQGGDVPATTAAPKLR